MLDAPHHPKATEFFDEWRTADRTASALERSLMARSMAAIDGRAAFPEAAELAKAKRLRGLADDLFASAMEEMTAKATSLRR